MSYNFTPIDASGAVTTGGTAQTALSAKGQFTYLFLQNPRAETETLKIDIAEPAVDGHSWELGPGDALEFNAATGVPIGIVSVLAATTGHKFILKYA